MNPYIKSPLNYTGSKYKLLPQILPLFPRKIKEFVDLFGGGYNVGVNVNAEMYLYNDINTHLVRLLCYFKRTNTEEIIERAEDTIEDYNLNNPNKDIAEQGFIKLRERFNTLENTPDLFVLVCYSFNHMMRFNSKGKFNVSYGGRKVAHYFNPTIKQNLIKFVGRIHEQDCIFLNAKFSNISTIQTLDDKDLVYCDPPYLTSKASYQDGRAYGIWNENDEQRLYDLLDDLHKRGVNFALSNAFENKGIKNEMLIDWSRKYNVYHLQGSYSNCSYNKVNRIGTDEVLITNYYYRGDMR